MFKKILFILFTFVSSLSFATSPTEILEQSDKMRSPFTEAKLNVKVISYKDGDIDNSIAYTVYTRGEDSLVDTLTGVDKGNRILLTKKGMYLSVNKSSRPIRITPMQRLMGQASFGDLASLSLSNDYTAELLENKDGIVKLKLKAKSRTSTYRMLHLWLDSETFRPIKSDAFLASGKIFKQMVYQVKDGRVVAIEYTDPKIKNKKTVMEFDIAVQKKLSKRFFKSDGMRGKIR